MLKVIWTLDVPLKKHKDVQLKFRDSWTNLNSWYIYAYIFIISLLEIIISHIVYMHPPSRSVWGLYFIAVWDTLAIRRRIHISDIWDTFFSFKMYLSSDYFNHALFYPQKIYINKWLLNMNYIRILHCYLLQLIYLIFVSLTLNWATKFLHPLFCIFYQAFKFMFFKQVFLRKNHEKIEIIV